MDFFNPVLVVLGGLSLPVKIAWGVWFLWGVGHLAWSFRPRNRATIHRTTQSTVRQSGVRPSAVRPPRKPSQSAVGIAPYGTSDFIAALDQELDAAAADGSSGAPEKSSAYR